MVALAGTALVVAATSDISLDRQRAIANKSTENYLQTHRRSSDRALERKLQSMVKQIASANGLGPDWTLYLMNEREPNALTPGGGVIFVHTGFIPIAHTEAQMAMVLAHEMAHSTQAHSAKRIRDMTRTAVLINTAAGEVSGAGQRAALDILAASSVSGYSRSAETQADNVGFQYFVRAGYAPDEASKVFRNMANEFGDIDGIAHALHGTHPRNRQRAISLSNKAGSSGRTVGRVSSRDYDRLTAKYR
ncbi:M48 family metallopeptidase [Shimia abyssi]|uniref:Peptidase M48-like protein n=1 Tax=Shimia abyssi TaxID=1662395 RepID=A0A2P8FB40_9RHOB|nr:M48 family metallopeptidase [Shimia abyssi]PSL18946.1 peptidase M48-like protein [Shimia abyssi]